MNAQVYVNKNIKFTYRDYCLLPENGKQVQLLEGEFFMTPAPIPNHQLVLLRIYGAIKEIVEKENAGLVFVSPCDVVLSKFDVVQPDVFFVAKENCAIIKAQNISGAPDFVMEVLSEKTKSMDKIIKKRLYEKYGVKEYWIVDIKKEEIEVHTLLPVRCTQTGFQESYKLHGLFKGKETLKSALFKNLKLKCQDVFR